MPHPLFTDTPRVVYPRGGRPVEAQAASALCSLFDLPAPEPADDPEGALAIGLAGGAWALAPSDLDAARPWMWAQRSADGTGVLTASEPALLFALVHLLHDGLPAERLGGLGEGLFFEPTFPFNRPIYDHVLTQVSRTVRRFDEEAYIARLARAGFTHLEVNGPAFHVPYETSVPTEYYPEFYTYCAGLNHFVDSTLTRGYYRPDYLQANLNRLKRLAKLGRKYGLKPGILCFEPRALPEHFFQRYPTLRGARVDHPFRSHLPRYTLAQDHPVSRDHYRQLMRNLMREVPDLAYLSVWTNDSGAGFEHTASLYVGRNGGPYLIREWRSHEKIAEAAGRSALRWLRLMRDAGAEFNPDFEVLLRVEPFKVEHDTIMDGMGDGLSVEAPSLLVRGYELPYHHPKYPEQTSAAGTLFHTEMEDREGELLEEHRAQGFEPKVHYSVGAAFNMEPLLGIPFPRLLHEKLASLREQGFKAVNAFGGMLHLEKTPYWPHPEVIRAAQFTPDESVDDVLRRAALRWAGEEHADDLLGAWSDFEEAVAHLPIVPLYSNFGFVWLRTWVRPLVPDIEAVPKADRLYYERFLVSTANNPNINDLGRDVLFELISEEAGRSMTRQFDENVLPRIAAVAERLGDLAEQTAGTDAGAVFADLRDRAVAFQCWATTQRNTCAWVAGVYGFLGTDDEAEKDRHRADLQRMIDLDLENTQRLLDLWESAGTEFILVSGEGETSFVFGENLGELLRRKLELTAQYRDRDPFIDRDILWRLP